VTESGFQAARQTALDHREGEQLRCAAILDLAALKTRDAADALIELGSRPDEPGPVLRAVGAALAGLLIDGLVSEWDIRDLSAPAADAFFE